MKTTTLGQSVKAAVRFIQCIHRDAEAMLKSLEEEMDRKGWQPTQKSRISSDLSNAFTHDGWIIKSIYRIYAPERKTGSTTRVVAIHLLFDPPDMYEEPQVLIAALRFPKPTAYSNLWNNWTLDGSEEVLKALKGRKVHIELTKKLLQVGFFPDASEGKAFAVPLCGLGSEEDLRQNAIKPLFNLLK